MAKNNILERLGRNRALVVVMALALIFGMMLGLFTEPVAAQRPSCDTSGTTVQFLGEACNGSTCTWSYNVCQTGFALSHWVLGLCDCFEDLLTAQGAEVGYIDADGNKTVMPPCPGEPGEPCWEFGLDPTTGLFGLKWDNNPGPENECWTFYLTIDQDVAQDNNVNWTSKFAACDPDGGTVTGPACSCDCVKLLAFKYYDVNQNETYDYEQNGEDNPIGDYELEGWEICLYDDEEEEIECLWTDEMGFVDFGCLPPGDYKVCENLPDGWINSQPGNGNGSDPPCYTETLQAGLWYFIVAEHDALNNTISIRINDGVKHSLEFVGGLQSTVTNTKFTLGSKSGVAGGLMSVKWDGKIDNVSVWNRVLTEADHTLLYNAGTGLAYTTYGSAGSGGEPPPPPSDSLDIGDLHVEYDDAVELDIDTLNGTIESLSEAEATLLRDFIDDWINL